jgi:hypothetical protein
MDHCTNIKRLTIELERPGLQLVEGQQIIDQHAKSLGVAAPILEQALLIFVQPISDTAVEYA